MTPAAAIGPRLPVSGGRRAIWAPAASLLLHAAALAGVLLLLHRSPPPQPVEEPAVAMVWEPSQTEDSVANPDAGEPPPAVPAPPDQPAAPPAPPEAAPPPPPPLAAPVAPPVQPMPAPPVLAELPPAAPMEPLPPALIPTPDALPPPPPPREAIEPPPPPPVETAAALEEPPPEELPLPPPPVPPPPRPAPPRQTAARAAPPPAAAPAAAQAPEPAVRGGSAVITGVTANASPLYRPPEPRYPESARRRNETGTVQVRVQVDEAGQVAQVEVVTSSGSRELDQLAQSYFAQWRWRPAMRNGQPVAGQVVTAITFRLSP